MSRTLVAVLLALATLAPLSALAATPVMDSLVTPGAPLQDSWREAARSIPGMGTRAHAPADAPYGPVPFQRGRSGGAMRVTLDGMPMTDPFSGNTTFELPLEALALIAQERDGALSLTTRRVAPGAPGALASVHSEALSSSLGGLQTGDRERYDLTLLGRRALRRGALELLATGQARAYGDREPRFVDSPYPGEASAGLGGASFPDGRLPGDGLSGASGYAHLAWAAPGERWRVALSGAGTHDDRREYVHAYLLDAAHMPRTKSRWAGGSIALEAGGPVELSLRASRTESSNEQGDGVWFGDFLGWARATTDDPTFEIDAPFFWLPGHAYGRFERSHARFTEYSAGATLHRSPRRTLHLLGASRAWELRHFTVTPVQLLFDGNGNPVGSDFTGYGYGDQAQEDTRGVRRSHRHELSVRDDWHPTERLWAGYTLGFVRVDQPSLVTVLDYYGFLHEIESGTHGALHLTPAVEVRHSFAEGREWGVTLQHVVTELSGRQQAEATGGLPASAWEASLTVASDLPGQWRSRARAWSHQADEPTTRPTLLYMPAPGARPGAEDARGLELSLERVVPARLAARLSGAWSRSSVRVLVSRRADIPWGATPYQDVATDDDRELALGAQGVVWLGGTQARRAWRLDALVHAESGVPYTPYQRYDEVTLAAVAGVPAGSLLSRRLPWACTLDLGATRTLRVAGVAWEATAQLYNALDRHNAAEVFAGTGQSDWTGWLETPDGQAYLQQAGDHGQRMYELAQHDPTHWQRPRTLTLVLRAAF